MDFYKLDINNIKQLTAFNDRFDPYSDFNAVSLWSWDINNDTQISFYNDNLIIKLPDYLNADTNIYSILGTNNIDATLNKLIEYIAREDPTSRIGLIPEITAINISNTHLIEQLKEDEDNHDYIYSVADLIELKGKKYKAVRRKLNKFVREADNFEDKVLDFSDKKTQKEILEMFEQWMQEQGKTDEESESEYIAIKRLVENEKNFNLISLGVYAKDKMIAFTISEIANKDYIIGHFGKYNYEFNGINQFLEIKNCEIAHKKGVKYLNLEQDLGIESLRESKMSYRPIKFLKKYTLDI